MGLDRIHSDAVHSASSARVYLPTSSRSWIRAHATKNMTGTSGRQRARTEALAMYPLPIPSAEIWVEFGLSLKRAFAKIESIHRESRTLESLRDVLLPKLVSGEVEVGFQWLE